MDTKRISRIHSWRGQPVMVVDGDQTVSGSLIAWGTQVIRIRDDAGKFHEFSNRKARVYQRPYEFQASTPRPDLVHPYVD